MQRQGTHVQGPWPKVWRFCMRNHTIFSTHTNMQPPQPHNHQKTLTPEILHRKLIRHCLKLGQWKWST
ncbi:hypothetical protein BDZ91DRAFT_721359 [Kalaharituber pfeilii]|nr:hypothetical protein BDZ91DRAFT_721359 [Kalaharituber pfeilii]